MFNVDIQGEKITIRNYQEGDEATIVPFLKETFGKQWTIEYWEWKYKQNPCGFFIFVAYNSRKELIGHIALQTKKGVYQGTECNFVYACDSIVKKEYRGNGISSLFIRLLPKNVVVFGFQNKIAMTVTKKYEREYSSSLHFCQIPIFNKTISITQRFRTFISKKIFSPLFEIKKLTENDLCILDALWEEKKDEITEGAVRNKNYALWRHYLNQNHMPIYSVYEKNKCIGYFSFLQKGPACYITDILLLNNSVSTHLISEIENVALTLHTNNIKIMGTDATIQRTLLHSEYVHQDNITASIAVLTTEKREPVSPYLTYTDTDLF
ncbi:MAG: GNAT family N-acetyltransferase [Candidatus Roizmanbacteria bacterium]|nr:GNAT family N-acetyltransferase [Candidatus Roizmanbacteria bacterium]